MNSFSKPSQLAIPALICALVAVYCCSGDQIGGQPEARILNGDEVKPGEYPFMAAIGRLGAKKKWVNVCGGTVLGKQHILTAARCVMNGNSSVIDRNIQVRLGCHQLSKCGSTYNVSKIMVHPGFGMPEETLFINNVAILKLASKIKFKTVKGAGAVGPVRLVAPSETCCDKGEKQVQAVGWGNIDNSGGVTDFLLEAELSSIPLGSCNSAWSGLINKDMICSGNATANACHRDYGGPLLLISKNKDPIQVGIVSNADRNCGVQPSVAMKVASFRKWINKCVQNKCKTLKLNA